MVSLFVCFFLFECLSCSSAIQICITWKGSLTNEKRFWATHIILYSCQWYYPILWANRLYKGKELTSGWHVSLQRVNRAAKRPWNSTQVAFVRTHPNLVFQWYKSRNFRAIRERLPISRIRIFLFLSYSFGIETINKFTHTRSSLENHTRFQTFEPLSKWY